MQAADFAFAVTFGHGTYFMLEYVLHWSSIQQYVPHWFSIQQQYWCTRTRILRTVVVYDTRYESVYDTTYCCMILLLIGVCMGTRTSKYSLCSKGRKMRVRCAWVVIRSFCSFVWVVIGGYLLQLWMWPAGVCVLCHSQSALLELYRCHASLRQLCSAPVLQHFLFSILRASHIIRHLLSSLSLMTQWRCLFRGFTGLLTLSKRGPVLIMSFSIHKK